jgi:hypothetical protein
MRIKRIRLSVDGICAPVYEPWGWCGLLHWNLADCFYGKQCGEMREAERM